MPSSSRNADGWRCGSDVTPSAAGKVEAGIEVSDTGAGIPAGEAGGHFRKIHAGRFEHHAKIRRHRPGAGDHAAAGGDPRRKDSRRKRVGQGQYVLRDAAFRAGAGCRPARASPAARAPPPPAISAARLLLVEDNLVNQKVVLAMLRNKGYRIDIANDGQEALKSWIRAEPPTIWS